MSIHTLRCAALAIVMVAGGFAPSMAQDSAWATFEAGMEAARGQELEQALMLFRRALNEAQEQDLRTAACYGAADTILKIFEGRKSLKRALACEGVRHYDCYLHSDATATQADAAARATWGRSRLTAECAPSTAVPWTLTAVASGTVLGGGLLLASSFSDAKALRGDKAAIVAANGSQDDQISAVNARGDEIEQKALVSYGVLGAGAFLAMWAILEWADVSGGPTGDAGRPGATLSVRF